LLSSKAELVCNLRTFRWFRPQCPEVKDGRRCMRAVDHLGHHGTYKKAWFNL
jgi:hypothetical protein